MKVLGLTVWYDESPTWLSAMVTSLAPHIDHLVAVDGAYLLYPDHKNWSAPDQHEALIYTCQAADLGLTIHVPSGPWMNNEVEKRTFLFKAAELIAEPDVDWLWIMDADEIVDHCPPDLRTRLEQTDLDAADITATERHPEAYSDNGSLRHFDWEPESRFTVRKLFRAVPGIRCASNHYTYVDGQGRRLWCNTTAGQVQVDGLDLTDLVIDHRTNYRPKNRHDKAHVYYNRRDQVGVEASWCEVCKIVKATQTATKDWEHVGPIPTRPGQRWNLASGWIEVCDNCKPDADAAADAEIRKLTNGQAGLEHMQMTMGKVPHRPKAAA